MLCLNRTIVGLKLNSSVYSIMKEYCLNRTIVGLKLVFTQSRRKLGKSLNRTIVGLKHSLLGGLQVNPKLFESNYCRIETFYCRRQKLLNKKHATQLFIILYLTNSGMNYQTPLDKKLQYLLCCLSPLPIFSFFSPRFVLNIHRIP